MGKCGRPKMAEEKRRGAKAYNVRYNEIESSIVEEKAAYAGTTPTEWIRAASLERQPKSKKVIPEINQQAYLQLSKLIEAATEQIWNFAPGDEDELHEILLEVRREVGKLQNILTGQTDDRKHFFWG